MLERLFNLVNVGSFIGLFLGIAIGIWISSLYEEQENERRIRKGYTSDCCDECGNFTMEKKNAKLICDSCGATIDHE